MKKCPENPTSVNCGLEALQFLKRNDAILIDPFDEGGAPIRISATSRGIEAVLKDESLTFDNRGDIAHFTCLACIEDIEVVHSRGNISIEGNK
jgi:hypothetical protein